MAHVREHFVQRCRGVGVLHGKARWWRAVPCWISECCLTIVRFCGKEGNGDIDACATAYQADDGAG